MSDRIDRLASRFKQPEVKKESPDKTLKPWTLYFTEETRRALDKAFLDAQHEMYPGEINRNQFYEAVLTYSLDHLPDVITRLRQDTN